MQSGGASCPSALFFLFVCVLETAVVAVVAVVVWGHAACLPTCRGVVNGWQASVGTMKLFFGCRRADEDFLYKKELLQFHDQGVLMSGEIAT